MDLPASGRTEILGLIKKLKEVPEVYKSEEFFSKSPFISNVRTAIPLPKPPVILIEASVILDDSFGSTGETLMLLHNLSASGMLNIPSLELETIPETILIDPVRMLLGFRLLNPKPLVIVRKDIS